MVTFSTVGAEARCEIIVARGDACLERLWLGHSDGEQFIGSLTARGRDYGPIDMRNSSGVECNGIWQLDSQSSGSASFTCTDGRTGTAELSVGDAAAGTMRGMLGGKPFAGTFERSPL
jgi:hypothetical protein